MEYKGFFKLAKLAMIAPISILSLSTIACTAQSPQAPAVHTAEVETPAGATSEDWRENYAYAVGLQAVIYGFPAVKALNMRYAMVEKPNGVIDTPINQLYHVRRAGDPTDANHSSVASDFLYSVAWYDVRREPIVITVPEANDRYYSAQFMEYYSDIFAYVGTRATGGKAGNYMLVDAHWEGETPTGIQDVIRAPTPTGAILIRIGFRDDRTNLNPVHRMQDESNISPLSKWLANDASPSTNRDVVDPAVPGSPLAFYVGLNRAMTENPPPAKDRAIMSLLRSVGLGPGQSDDLSKLDAGTRKGLERAYTDGMRLLSQVSISGGETKVINHWAYNQSSWGRTGETDDFLTRSATQSYSGFLEHQIEEVVKLRAHFDGDGEILDGRSGRYILHFGPDQIPQAKAFWSVTVYDSEYNLFANPLKRYSIGSLDRTLSYDDDGGVTFYIQAGAPDSEFVSNWLPVPKAPFNLFLRAYLPNEDLIKQDYVPPAIVKVK